MAKRKRRTREHILEDLSENHLERIILDSGHLLRRPSRDYGVDVTMFHFSESGELENGEVRFQLKATDSLKLISNGEFATVRLKTGDIQYWSMELFPFILVLYDAKSKQAFWIEIQDLQEQSLDLDQVTATVRIPVGNELSCQAIELFRQKSLNTIKQFESQDVKRQSKPR